MDSNDTILFIVLIVLLALSAFFSSAETALTTVNRIRIRNLADGGNKNAKTVLKITDDSSKMLTAILIGNNIVNLSAASLTTTLAYSLGGSMVAIASGILTVAILLFGEITPKTMATIHAEKVSLAYAPIIHIFMKIMTPFVFIINGLTNVVLFILRVDPNDHKRAMTENELRTIVNVSHEDGVIESEEKEMIYNVVDLGDAKAKDVMVPRVHVTFADVNCTYEELIDIFREDKFTRLPIYEDTTDNVIGTINMKDLLLYDYGNTKEFHIRDIMREAYFTYEYKNISELLVEMRESIFNIAIVLDEYGEMTGLITLEDILEEIVGNIFDEHDAEEEQIVEEADGSYVIDGMTDFDDVCELLKIHGEELEDFDTLSGFLISRINKISVNGEHYQVSAYGYRFDVLLVEHRVIRTVRVTKEPLKEEKQILSE